MHKITKLSSAIKFIILSVIASLFISCTGGTDKNISLPIFDAITLENKTLQSKDWSNKVVILNFWATSCSACIAEMPKLAQIYNKYQSRGLNMVAISMQYDAPAYVMNFAKTKNLPFPIAMDLNGEIANKFGGITLTPTTFVYIKGKRVQKIIGEPDWKEFEEILEKNL